MNRRLLRLTLLFLALTLVLGAVNLLLVSGQKPVTEPESLSLFGKAPTDIDALQIKNEQGEYEIRYDDQNGGYVVGSLPTDLIDLNRFVDFMVAFADLKAAGKAAETVDDPAKYGLDKLGATVNVQFSDGENHTLSLGDRETVSGNTYLSVSGNKGLYTLNSQLAETLLSGQETFLSLLVTPELTVSSPLSAIRDAKLEGGPLPVPIHIKAVSGADAETKLQALSFGTATHLITLKGTHALDQEGGIRVLGSLLGIRAIHVLGFDLKEDKLADYGFDSPDFRAEFTLAGSGETLVLRLKKAENDAFFAKVDGRNAVYLINRPAFYDVKPRELVLRYLLNPMLLDIAGLTVTTPETDYDITYQRPTGTEGEARLDGQAVPVQNFQAFYRLLTSAASDGTLYEGKAPEGEPALTLTYRYKNADKKDDVLKFYPLEARRMAVSVNGVTELVIRDSFVHRLIEAAEDLKNGNPIEEVW